MLLLLLINYDWYEPGAVIKNFYKLLVGSPVHFQVHLYAQVLPAAKGKVVCVQQYSIWNLQTIWRKLFKLLFKEVLRGNKVQQQKCSK